MSTFASSLPNDLLLKLNEAAQKLSIPKNKIIEKALKIYLEHLKRAEYLKSYKKAADDINIINIAEEGMADYLKQINK